MYIYRPAAELSDRHTHTHTHTPRTRTYTHILIYTYYSLQEQLAPHPSHFCATSVRLKTDTFLPCLLDHFPPPHVCTTSVCHITRLMHTCYVLHLLPTAQVYHMTPEMSTRCPHRPTGSHGTLEIPSSKISLEHKSEFLLALKE